MAHTYDVSLKALFQREGDGIIRRLLFGGKIIEFLATEQPQFSTVAYYSSIRSAKPASLKVWNST